MSLYSFFFTIYTESIQISVVFIREAWVVVECM